MKYFAGCNSLHGLLDGPVYDGSVCVPARVSVHGDHPARGDYPVCDRVSKFRQV